MLNKVLCAIISELVFKFYKKGSMGSSLFKPGEDDLDDRKAQGLYILVIKIRKEA